MEDKVQHIGKLADKVKFVKFLWDYGNIVAYPTGCVCLSVCDAGVLSVNTQTNRVDFW